MSSERLTSSRVFLCSLQSPVLSGSLQSPVLSGSLQSPVLSVLVSPGPPLLSFLSPGDVVNARLCVLQRWEPVYLYNSFLYSVSEVLML